MSTIAISIRAEEALAARVDAFAAQIMAEKPGLKVSRTEAIVMLLTEALDTHQIGAPHAAKPRAKPRAKRTAPAAKKGAKRARKP